MKDDVKAIISVIIILLLISGIGLFGGYIFLVENTDEMPKQLFQGIVQTILPEEEEVSNTIVDEGQEDFSNKIASAIKNEQSKQENIIDEEKPKVEEESYSYYYQQLNSYEKIIYDGMKNNKENLKTGTYKLDFGDVFDELLNQEDGVDLLQEYYQSGMESYLYDNPDVFYLEPTKMYINIQTTKKLFTTTYDVYIDQGNNANYLTESYSTKSQIIDSENQIEQEVQKILGSINETGDYEKILAIHDYLVENVVYEESLTKSNIYNMYGTLVNKESVCEGYAKAFKYLMDQIGIDSIVVIGKATDSNGNTQNHAWNYVYLNNAWYAVDVTWDDPILIGGGFLSPRLKYKYFLKGSRTMSVDHVESYTFVENGKVYTHPTLTPIDY